MKRTIILTLTICLAISQDALYQKVVLKDPGALCLDGTPGAYYIHRGSNPQKILLIFEGGAWCGETDLQSTLESCYQRSKDILLGTSKGYPETITYSKGILSNSIKNDFREATRVFLKYCDGAGHQGYRAQPLKYKDVYLYFRGHNITQAQLNDIERTQGLFSKAVEIIVLGRSVGGTATFLWANYIREKAKAKNVYCVPDAGIFLDAPHFQSGRHTFLESFQNLFKLSNVEISPPVPECVKDHKSEPYRCMFAEVLYKYIKVPLFPIQSLYDSWTIPNILGIDCLKDGTSLASCTDGQRNHIEQYRKNLTRVLQKIGEYSEQNGYWAPSCSFHTFTGDYIFYSPDYRIPMNSKYSADASLLAWINKQNISHHHIDKLPWPSNKPCSGLLSYTRRARTVHQNYAQIVTKYKKIDTTNQKRVQESLLFLFFLILTLATIILIQKCKQIKFQFNQ